MENSHEKDQGNLSVPNPNEPKIVPSLRNPNWLKLKNLFKSKKTTISNAHEHLFAFKNLIQKNEDGATISYRFAQLGDTEIRITKPEIELDIKTVSETSHQKLDTTGFLLWPSEEILGLLIMDKIMPIVKAAGKAGDSFRVLEIGAGYSGLAALCLAQFLTQRQDEWSQELDGVKSVEIIVTDGVKDCVQKVSECIDLNFPSSSDGTKKVAIRSAEFNWKDYESFERDNGKFDLIFGADVLFFRQYHQALSEALSYLLKDSSQCPGKVILMQPDRDNTLSQFIEVRTQHFGAGPTVEDLADTNLFKEEMVAVRLHPKFEKSKHDIKILTFG